MRDAEDGKGVLLAVSPHRKYKGLMTKNLFAMFTASSVSKRKEKQSQLGILLVWDGP